MWPGGPGPGARAWVHRFETVRVGLRITDDRWEDPLEMSNRRGTRRGMMRCAGLCLVAAGVAATVAGSVAAATLGARTVTIEPATSKIHVDGILDEPAWKHATRIPLPYEVDPGDNIPAPVRTDCLITYDQRHLYIAFRAYDPDVSKIRAHLTDRDTAFDDDFVGVVLDTFHDGRRGFEFFVNPLGVQMDLINNDVGGGEDPSWDAIWDSAGHITPSGYVVEMAIPFSSLRFPKSKSVQTWGFGAMRVYPRDRRYLLTSEPRDRNRSCQLCQISELTGLSGIEPGHDVELDPTLTSLGTTNRDEFPGGALSSLTVQGNAGLTGHWGITPNLTLTGAVNPDFSQVEADAAQLSINRTFTLFYPEKRPFFLEGSDYFETPIHVLHTRMIADPSWGAKLTGKTGPNALGLFVAQDDLTNIIFPGNEGSTSGSFNFGNTAAVVRYRRDVGSSSVLGGIVTSREGGGYSNQVYGVDGLLRVTAADSVKFQLLGSETTYPDAIASQYGEPEHGFNGSATFLRYSHDSKYWNWSVQYTDYERGFRADLGFVPKVDTRFVKVLAGHTWWGRPGAFLSRFQLGVNRDETKDHDGVALDRRSEIWALASGPWQSHVMLNVGSAKTLYDGVLFDQDYAEMFVNARPSGSLSVGTYLRFGDDIDYENTRSADSLTLRPTLTFKLGRHLQTRIRHTFQRMNVSGGRLYRANLTDLRLVYQFSIRTFVRFVTQYTDIDRNPTLYTSDVEPTSRQLFNQVLFSYKVNPQTMIFLGYSDNSIGQHRIDMTTMNRTIFLKIGYAWLL